jgi:hypothetical protein
MVAEWRLCNMQTLRRAGEMKLLGYDHKIIEPPQVKLIVHRRII